MLHTGSRGFGYNIADHFFRMAKDLNCHRDLIAFESESDLGQEYLNLHNMAGNFAIANRYLILEAIKESLNEIFPNCNTSLIYEISHNLVQEEYGSFVHRKGATRAFPDMNGIAAHPIIIPGSMCAGAALLIGLEGAKESLYSINHGAGRLFGREKAKRQFNQNDVNSYMANIKQTFDGIEIEGILINSRDVPLDESRDCYKSLDLILNAVEVAGLAKVVDRMYPLLCIKGND